MTWVLQFASLSMSQTQSLQEWKFGFTVTVPYWHPGDQLCICGDKKWSSTRDKSTSPSWMGLLPAYTGNLPAFTGTSVWLENRTFWKCKQALVVISLKSAKNSLQTSPTLKKKKSKGARGKSIKDCIEVLKPLVRHCGCCWLQLLQKVALFLFIFTFREVKPEEKTNNLVSKNNCAIVVCDNSTALSYKTSVEKRNATFYKAMLIKTNAE